VLGDMLELGAAEEEGHRQVGRRAADVVDLLIAVGPRAAVLADEARAAGGKDVRHFEDKAGVAAALREELRRGDHALFKGSRGMALETVIAELIEADGSADQRRHA
jgi:UDP-N-acetylmuramoyl-tripeptide--D-alanyl-D-alanine ligase